jgi:Interferon-induced transmembrane protein
LGNADDVRGAEKASANARTWVIVSAVAGIVLLDIFLVAMLSADSSYSYDPYSS